MTYRALTQDGMWLPGGAARIYMEPRQRAGVSESQLSVGRNLLPAEYVTMEGGGLFSRIKAKLTGGAKKKEKLSPTEQAAKEHEEEIARAERGAAETESTTASSLGMKTLVMGALVAGAILMYAMKKKKR